MRVARTDELSDAELASIRALMLEAFPGSFSEHDWANSLGGLHVLIEEDGAPVSHASVVARVLHAGDVALATGYVEAVATRPDRSRRGLASAVMGVVGEHIRATYRLGALSTGAPSFYTRLGWERWPGPSFVRREGSLHPTPEEDGGIMILRTPATPALDPGGPLACEWRPGDVW